MAKTKIKTEKESKAKTVLIIVIIVLLIGTAAVVVINMLSPIPEEDELSVTSIALISNDIDSEDVSWVEVGLYTPKSSVTFDDVEDTYTASNFELSKSGRASGLTFDLTDYDPGVWIKIVDSNSYYAEDWHFIPNRGENINKTTYVYHRPSDVNFNNLNLTTMAAELPCQDGDYEVHGQTMLSGGNFTIVADFPRYSTNQPHYGTNWVLSTTEFNALSLKNRETYWDQRNWRTAAPVYVLTDDTYNEMDTTEASMTSTFGIKFTANDTISDIDANVLQINFTIANNYVNDWEYQVSGTLIYLYSLRNLNANFNVDYEIVAGTDICISNMQSGWASIPGKTVTAFTALSAIGA